MVILVERGESVNELNNRIKDLRKLLNLNQEDFGDEIGLTKSSISNIEKGIRNVTEQHIKLISNAFNFNEDWLRYGTGEIFVQNETFSLDDYAKKNNLSDLEIDIIKSYMDLDTDVRKAFIAHLQTVFGKHNEVAATSLKESYYTENYTKEEYINEELESYRLELEAEQKG